ncbi:MAG: cation-translocating P-type ATPase [Bacillota bacterium]|nr:cation-translocating P-type ATPase [Bacillota bacterium]
MSQEWYTFSREETLQRLRTDLHRGLTAAEVEARRREHGPNELAGQPPTPLWRRFLDQFKDFLVLILLGSAAIAGLLGEVIDAVAILAIVVLNAVMGLIQEGRAERALAALKKLSVPVTTVVREGETVRVPSPELVPGDIVVLNAGDLVPADLRLLETVNLKVDESALTGESVPVDKHAETLVEPGAAVGDRVNSAHLGTTVTYGRGLGVVTATGMKTELGKIAELVSSVGEEATPLQEKLEQFGKWLGIACLLISALVFILTFTEPGVLSQALRDPRVVVDTFMTAVALAVAAIPEGLPAVVTIVLALGMQRMVSRHAIIRRLPAVETLGAATHICSDKTGTLTENKMTVRRVYLGDGTLLSVTGQGYEPHGEFLSDDRPIAPDRSDLRWLFRIAAGCNDASLITKVTDRGEVSTIVGDPTEGALVALAAKGGLLKEEFDVEAPRIDEVPFDSVRKRMTTVHRLPEGVFALAKGAPDMLLALCSSYLDGEAVKPLGEGKRAEIAARIGEMAGEGLRVLGLAYRPLGKAIPTEAEELERDLVFVGLAGMLDPIRPEVKEAVQTCREAGITPIMVTGDYPQTARAIGAELGMMAEDGRVVTGVELEKMTDAELDVAVREARVFARVSPEHKLRIVEALKRQEKVVAMTGDGVNDAPALRMADIGVAMGITGTDVAKEAADMVLTDDNFASIVAAVGEGRAIFENIRKAIIYLLSCNVGELLLFFIAILMRLPAPLTAVQILMVNLVTDGFPALALGVDPAEPGLMKIPPRDTKAGIISRNTMIRLIVVGVLVAVGALVAFLAFHDPRNPESLPMARTAAFLTMSLSQLWRALSNRSERISSFHMPLFSNPKLILAIGASIAATAAVIFVPYLRDHVFELVLPPLAEWEVVLSMSLIPFIGAEALKIFRIAAPDEARA